MKGMQYILYLGADYKIEKYPALTKLNWRCIYTTNQSAELSDAFEDKERPIRAIYSRHEYDREETKLNASNPMLVYINGVGTPENEEEALDRDVEASELTDTLYKLLKSGLMVKLIMVGYDPYKPGELKPGDLYSIATRVEDKRIEIYGLNDVQESCPQIRVLEKRNQITVFSQDLGEECERFISTKRNSVDEEIDIPQIEQEDLKYSVYINGRIQKLNQKQVNNFNEYGRVLTIEEMTVPTISRALKADYFYRFLKSSPYSPQWYGYAKKNAFAVDRDFSEELYEKVVKGLESDRETPIIISGQSSSGKSIALAALAYRVFSEKKYPVLYVNNPEINFSISYPAGKALDNILLETREYGGRVLVILDWSVYNLQRNSIIRKISNIYNNRGHNVLFVASAMYSTNIEGQYHVVKTRVDLNDDDQKAFKELMIDKGQLQRNMVEKWFKYHSNQAGILSMLYLLIYDLRPHLERGIKKEITSALEDTKKEISTLDAPKPIELPITAFASKLAKLGFTSSSTTLTSEEEQDIKKEIMDGLQPFCESIAVATLFKLRMPITLANKLLNIPDCENKDDYCRAVFNAPWLYCAMDDDKYASGEYFITFRDPMDAKIYLNSIGKQPREQMHIVAHTIRAIKSEKDPYYEKEVRFLEAVIRMIGPNSDDEIIRESWINEYGSGCTAVIEALRELREANIIEPRLVAQEITYLREYYGQQNNADIRSKIKSLEDAIRIARQIISIWNNGYEESANWQQGTIDSITVESIFSELQLEKIRKKAIQDGAIKEDLGTIETSPFSKKKETLTQIIHNQPENSYPYVALLESFRSYYEDNSELGNNDLINHMSDIISLVDVTEDSIPAVEQNGHYQREKNMFLSLFDKVYSNSSRADEYFDKLLAIGSPIGVYMKARSILYQAGIDLNEELNNPYETQKCNEVLDMLENPDYSAIMQTHPASQFLRLRLTWLLRNKKPVFAAERQNTFMRREDWERIRTICNCFRDNIFDLRMGVHYKATVYYIMALSYAQLGDYESATRIWEHVKEEDIFTTRRQRTWHVLCKPDGTPILMTGTFNRPGLQDRRIYIKEMKRPVLYRSLQSINKIETRGEAPDLCIGTSYRGFAAFAEKPGFGRG